MGTVIVNGKRFDGNNVTIRNGKIIIDGKAQDGELHGNVEVEVTESVAGCAKCVASVTGVEARGNVATGVSMSGEHAGQSIRAESSVAAGDRAGGAIRAVAFASADNRLRKGKKR